MRKHSNFGFSSILLTFVMICMMTFSALTLLTANSDYRLSSKVASRNAAYYEAEVTAYSRLAEIDAALADAYQTSGDSDTYYRLAAEALAEGAAGTFSTDGGQTTYSYEITASAEQALHVELLICYPDSAGSGFYQIQKWQSVHIATTTDDQILHLMGSDD